MGAPLYNIEAGYVDSRGTINTREHYEVVREHGLDGHASSACPIVLKGFRQH